MPAACEQCRRAKVKCSGTRPRCFFCIAKDRQCVFPAETGESRGAALKRKHSDVRREIDQLRRSHEALEQIVKAVQTRDESEASSIVRRLRETQDPAAVAKQLEGGDLLLQLHVAPNTNFRFSFPYLKDMPEALLIPDNPYLQSPLYESTFASPSLDSKAVSRIEKLQPQYLKPYSAARIADPRLAEINLVRWTNVSTDNEFMKKLLHTYFCADYQAFPFFHKDYFLDDMISGSTKFCSPLLVNAVLAHACTSSLDIKDRAEYWNPNSLAYKFFSEARRLWELEQLEPKSVTTVQAGMVLNVTYNVYSMDKVGLTYGAQAASIAIQLGMFEPLVETMDKADQVVRGYTAWCLYFSLSFQCYHLMTPCPLRDAPAVALPDPDEDPDCLWYHNIMFTICQLLVPEGENGNSAETAAAKTHIAHSKICFETLVRLYYLRNGYEGANMMLLHYLAVLSFSALEDLEASKRAGDSDAAERHRRSTLILTAKGLHEQGKNYFMSETISRVLQGQMAPNDFDILASYTGMKNEDPRSGEARAKHVKAQYPLKIADITAIPDNQRLENMITQYEALALEQTGAKSNGA